MITTIETKAAQLQNGFYQTGTGSEEILILGSCRTIAYLSYLARWNAASNRFTIRRIDPCDWAVEGISMESLENDGRILSVLKTASIFIHEYLVNYAMFNTERSAYKNIYQFGMSAPTDITIPNFNDHMVLENDYVAYDAPIPDDYVARGEAEIEKFCGVCKMSSFPEFAEVFRTSWRSTRFFWRPNHTSAKFSIWIFAMMNAKFLHLDLTEEFWELASQEDLFKAPNTSVTQRDRDAYGIKW